MHRSIILAAAVILLSGSAHAQCPASVTLTAVYHASQGQDGSGPAAQTGVTYDTMGTILQRAVMHGFDTSSISTLCKPWKARYAYSTKGKSGTLNTMRGLFGGDGIPTGSTVSHNIADWLAARTSGDGLSTYGIDAANTRVQKYLAPWHLEDLDDRIINGQDFLIAYQPPSGAATPWLQIYTHYVSDASKRPKLTIWLQAR